jgi:sulfoquinovosidase
LDSMDIVRLLDIAMFSPLFVVDSGTDLAGNALRHAFARAAAVYGALAPYRDFCSEWWVREGIPAFCNPVLYYPDETALWKLDDQYMFGPDMMIAPSLSDDGGARRLHLPNDSWMHLWTSRRYSKGSVVVDAPAGKPAVFYREGSSFAKLFDTVRRMATRL